MNPDLGEAMKSLIATIAREVARNVVAEIRATEEKLGDRIAYTEAEAAAQYGIAAHVLADARRRGLLHGRRCGKKMLYARDELTRFLLEK